MNRTTKTIIHINRWFARNQGKTALIVAALWLIGMGYGGSSDADEIESRAAYMDVIAQADAGVSKIRSPELENEH